MVVIGVWLFLFEMIVLQIFYVSSIMFPNWLFSFVKIVLEESSIWYKK